jgi:isopentenyl-diphosphate delta-isomerase
VADISRRKEDHLDLCISGDVGFKETTTLFECVRFVHDALPELDIDAIDLSTRVLGKRLRAPLLIAGMTGGSERAGEINRALAAVAEERGYAFGLGSQRAMLTRPETAPSYRVRDVAPTVLLLGNLGAVQAARMSTEQVEELVQVSGLDALCIHLNPAMEVVQPEGDRDFTGILETFGRLARELSVPVIAKETGCGLSGAVARRLAAVGVRHVDVSGAGGTSWVGVETRRASGEGRDLGLRFWEWGVPTAASVALVAPHHMKTVFATGGMKDGLDVAKAIALGASAAGFARPVLQAYDSGGHQGAVARLATVEAELRTAMLLTGSANVADLARAPRLIIGDLAEWLRQAHVDRDAPVRGP